MFICCCFFNDNFSKQYRIEWVKLNKIKKALLELKTCSISQGYIRFRLFIWSFLFFFLFYINANWSKLMQINRNQSVFIQGICSILFVGRSGTGKLSVTSNYTHLSAKFILLSNHSCYIPGKQIGCKSGHVLKTLPYSAFSGYSKATAIKFSFKNFLVNLASLVKSVWRPRYWAHCTVYHLPN